MCNKEPLTYKINDIDFCDDNCPFFIDHRSLQITGRCLKYGELDFYDWYLAKCVNYEKNDSIEVDLNHLG
jgi:hypothetical protein